MLTFSATRAQEAREDAGLGLRDAARRLDVVRQALINIESGTSVPNGRLIGRMASLYGVPTDAFYEHSRSLNETSTAVGNPAAAHQTPIESAAASPNGG